MPLLRAQVPTGDGWHITLARLAPSAGGPPVLLVPGFAMNSFILGYHPRGRSLVEHLGARGLDVWTADLRGQGSSRGPHKQRAGLAEQALVDLPAALEHVRRVTGAAKAHVVGCSLGGVLVYTLLAHRPAVPIDRIVAIGSPLRWDAKNPVLHAFALAGPVLRRVPLQGSRLAARVALPVATRLAPALLGLYMNADHCDLSEPHRLVRTVEDPPARMNGQLAAWIRTGDLVVDGLRVSEKLRTLRNPLMVVTGSGDGIAPPDACDSVRALWGGPVQRLHVGDATDRWAHADLFIGDAAERRVFEPIAAFLRA